MGFGAAGNIRIFSGADGSLRHEIVSGVTTGVSLVLSDFDYDGHPDLLWGWKNTDSYWTGGGVYKGSTFEYLGDWGIDNDQIRSEPVTITFEGKPAQVQKDRYLGQLLNGGDFPSVMGSLGVTVSEVADLGFGIYAFTEYQLSPDALAALDGHSGVVNLEPDALIVLF